MISDDSVAGNSSQNGWQRICDIPVSTGDDNMSLIRMELEAKLEPLHLPLELMDRLMHSTQEIMQHAALPEAGSPSVHMFIYVTQDHRSKAGPWGFFRIERINRTDDNLPRDHAVEFYLYPEGK